MLGLPQTMCHLTRISWRSIVLVTWLLTLGLDFSERSPSIIERSRGRVFDEFCLIVRSAEACKLWFTSMPTGPMCSHTREGTGDCQPRRV